MPHLRTSSRAGVGRIDYLADLDHGLPAVSAVGDTLREHGFAVPAAGGMTFLQAKTANEVLKSQERRLKLQKLRGELVDRGRAEALVQRHESPATPGRFTGGTMSRWSSVSLDRFASTGVRATSRSDAGYPARCSSLCCFAPVKRSAQAP